MQEKQQPGIITSQELSVYSTDEIKNLQGECIANCNRQPKNQSPPEKPKEATKKIPRSIGSLLFFGKD